MKKVYKALPAILFCGFIACMMILFIVLPKKEYSSSEKRYLSQMPKFTVARYLSGDFEDEFEDFLSDQTAGRNFWVGLSAYLNYASGNNGSTGVYLCEGGYLINDPENNPDQLMKNIGYIEDFAAGTDVPVTVTVAPSTGYICEDMLPQIHRGYRDDQYFAQMKEALTSADFIDLRESFRSAYEAGDQLYYKTDHHWTTLGAYTAYQELSDALGYTPLGESAYHVTAYPGFYGSTYSTSGFWKTEPDEIEVWDNEENSVQVKITDGSEVTEQEDMFFYDHLEEDDKYPVFLDGNHPYTQITNENAEIDETLLIVKDSFAHSLTPFLADHYKRIIMVDMRYYSEPLQPLIEQEQVDRVAFIYSIDNLSTDDNLKKIDEE